MRVAITNTIRFIKTLNNSLQNTISIIINTDYING